MLCPLPVIRVQDRVRQLAPGARLRVYCTDPGAKADVPAWCRVHGHRVLDVVESHDEVIILIETGVS
ncbi:SirA family protein [Acidihalobacter ferrooxydans]|uniref:SirA family protein n=1 Tax=Acidihalobacter ferrooxydans TaxID=1765967 RepID=A0A1P8UKV7_9GAMM|nr:SirA family protein [Acidihalobacter ferrooxydans]